MEQHISFAAFISYRHLPLDGFVAARLHRLLERYAVPRAVARRMGKRRLGRVFRDNEELPITSDLTATILEALDNSEFLVVVCTPETQKSPWVLREIAHFLSNHDRNNLLAVLAAGEPQEAFPPQICRRQLPDGSWEEVEPLACDVRGATLGAVGKRLRSEVTRLAAAFLGCPYDELKQRERQYKTRLRLTIASLCAAVLLGFTAMVLKKNGEIAANYTRAQVNQSRYLSDVSASLLAQGDRLGAIQVALAALPEEPEDRPLIPEAEYALGNALYAYGDPDSGRIPAMLALKGDARLKGVTLSGDGRLAVAWDVSNNLYGFDALTGARLWKLAPAQLGIDKSNADISGVHLRRDREDFFVLFSRCALCLEGRSGVVSWRCDRRESDFAWGDQTRDGSTCALLEKTGMFQQAGFFVRLVDGDTGKTLGRYPVATGDYDWGGGCFSPAGDRFLCWWHTDGSWWFSDGDRSCDGAELSLSGGGVRPVVQGLWGLEAVAYGPKEEILQLAGRETETDGRKQRNVTLLCQDGTGETLWTGECTLDGGMLSGEWRILPAKGPGESAAILCQTDGYALWTVDPGSGSTRRLENVENKPLYMGLMGADNDFLRLVFADGWAWFQKVDYGTGGEPIGITMQVGESTAAADIGGDTYGAVPWSSDWAVIHRFQDIGSEAKQVLAGKTYLQQVVQDEAGGRILALYGGNEAGTELVILDRDALEAEERLLLPGYVSVCMAWMGEGFAYIGEEGAVWFHPYDGSGARMLHPAGERRPLVVGRNGNLCVLYETLHSEADRRWAELQIVAPGEKEALAVTLPTGWPAAISGQTYDWGGNGYLGWVTEAADGHTLDFLRRKTGERISRPVELPEALALGEILPYYALATADHRVLVGEIGTGRILLETEPMDGGIQWLRFAAGDGYLVCAAGLNQLVRLDLSGERAPQTLTIQAAVEVFDDEDYGVMNWEGDVWQLYTGGDCYLVDWPSFGLRARLPGRGFCHAERGSYLFRRFETLYETPILSLAQLMEQGRAAAAGQPLTQKERARYYLD